MFGKRACPEGHVTDSSLIMKRRLLLTFEPYQKLLKYEFYDKLAGSFTLTLCGTCILWLLGSIACSFFVFGNSLSGGKFLFCFAFR